MSATSDHPGFSGGITQFFVRHRVIGWLAMLAVLAWGWFSAKSLPQQEDPSFPTHDAVLVTVFPGANAHEVEQQVTAKLEQTIRGLPAVENLTSRTRAGVSAIVITLKPAGEAEIARQWDKLRAMLRKVTLPRGCEAPSLDTDFQLPATLLFAITAPVEKENVVSLRSLTTVADMLADEVRGVPGVGRVQLSGEAPAELELLPSSEGMMRHRVMPEALNQALGAIHEAGGQAKAFPNETTLLDLPVVAQPDGNAVRLRDIATLRDEPSSPDVIVETLHRTDSGPVLTSRSVLLAVEMKRGGNTHDFNDAVRSAIDRASAKLPAGVEVITVSDQPAATAHRIHQFMHCFVEAVIVVVLVALLLMDWRTALVVAVAIPLTIAMTMGGMALLKVPLQQISIAALIIALGMLVDDPVVAADGINRELAAGRSRGVAAWLGPFKLRRAIFFGTLINIAAFLPLALLPGDMGAFIISLPVVITLALVSSRIVSMTFVPLLGHHLLRGQRGFESGGEVRRFFLLRPVDKLLAALLPRYRGVLQWALRHPAKTVAFAYGLLALSCGLTPFFGKQFFPAAERNQMLVDIEHAEGSTIHQTRDVCHRVASVLSQEDAITRAAIIAGAGVPMFYYNVLPREPGSHVAQILINTRSADDVPTLLVKLRTKLDHDITDARCIVKQLQQGPALETPIQIQLTGDDLDSMRTKADEIAHALENAGAYKVHDDLGPHVPLPAITVNENATTLGLTSADVGRMLHLAKEGREVATVMWDGLRMPARLRSDSDASADPATWQDITIPTPDGRQVPLSALATVSMKPDYPVISHINQQRSVTVKAFAPFGELASRTLQRAKPAIARVSLPQGWSIAYAGEERELKNSQREMSRVLAISLALIALAMLVQFRSFTKSLVVMLTVPLGLIGAFVGLATVHASFGFMALLGIVSLAGVIVSHIIVLSDFIEEARSEGMPLEQALVQAGLVRLRAVLATVFATVCGLIPLAVSGGQLWQPLTSVHIFGLLFGTLLTLGVLPVLYFLFCARLKWIR